MSATPDADEQRRIDAVSDAIRSLDVPAPAALRERVEAMATGATRANTGAADADAGAADADAGAEGAVAGAEGANAGAEGANAGAADANAGADARRTRRRRRPRPRLALAGGLLTAVAAVAVALLLVLGGASDDDRGAPATVRQVAAVALQDPTGPAPASRPGGTLDAAVAPVSFPDWSARPPGPAGTAWSASGARSDSVGGRDVETVYYDAPGGQRVGYSIAAGDELPVAGGRYVRRNGVATWVYEIDGAPAVMWYRDGRTCVVAGRDVDVDTLVTLATSEPV